MVKRVNQRAVNKNSMETLAYIRRLRLLPELPGTILLHKADSDNTTGLDKIVKFGQQVQAGSRIPAASLEMI